MNCAPKDRLYFEQQYEALRREALGLRGGSKRGHGLALFLSQGMAAWLAALCAFRPPRTAASSRAGASPPGPAPALSARSDLIALLAAMVLACRKEAHHE